MKNFMIFLSVVLMIAVALFWRQVWGIFAGMSVLEAMNTIVTFILHVAVATIAAYAVMLIPEYVLPWLKALRWKRSGRRSAEGRRQKTEDGRQAVLSMPKFRGKDQLLMQMLAQMATPTLPSPKRKTRLGEGDKEEPVIRLDL